jgi:hypothetical protein
MPPEGTLICGVELLTQVVSQHLLGVFAVHDPLSFPSRLSPGGMCPGRGLTLGSRPIRWASLPRSPRRARK